MAGSSGSSPPVFIDSASSIANDIAKIVLDINKLTDAMVGQASSISSSDHVVADNGGNFNKASRTCSLFIGRFGELFKYGDIGKNWKADMVNGVARGEYQSFLVYMNTLISYLDQCSDLYHTLSKNCKDAIKQLDASTPSACDSNQQLVQGIRLHFDNWTLALLGTGEVIIGTTGLYILARLFNVIRTSLVGDVATAVLVLVIEALFSTFINRRGIYRRFQQFLPCIGGTGILVLACLFNYYIHPFFNWGVAAAATFVFMAGSFLFQIDVEDNTTDDASDEVSSQRNLSIELKESYVSIDRLAAEVNSSMTNLRDGLRAVASRESVHMEEGFNRESFSTALELLLNGIKKAYSSVQLCHQRLRPNTGRTLAEI